MEAFLMALAGRVRQQGWRTVHVFAGEPGEYVRHQLAELRSPYFVANFPLSRAGAQRLVWQLRPYQPEAICTHYLSKFSSLLRLIKKGTGAHRLIITDRSSGVASERSALGHLLARARGLLTASYVDRVIAVSRFVHRRAVEDMYLPARKVQTIYNGVDTTKYTPAAAVTNPVFTVAFAGQLIPEKGIRTLLEAARGLAAEGACFRVLIAGAGPQEGQLRRFCAENELTQVEFLGHVDWVPRLFSSVDVVVVPSLWEEAFGWVVAEAMACGACVLASDAGGIPEIVGPRSEAGRIFRRGDAADLRRQLGALMRDPAQREKMRAAARARVVDQFSLGRMVDEFARVVQGIDQAPAESA
jgi:glycosyltransferase involved in cell wall biosynthesis